MYLAVWRETRPRVYTLIGKNRVVHITSMSGLQVSGYQPAVLIITVRKRSLRRLCFYTCLSFCPQGGGCLVPGGCVPGPGGLVLGWGVWSWEVPGPVGGGRVETSPGTATAAGGTHPTWMHTCWQWFSWHDISAGSRWCRKTRWRHLDFYCQIKNSRDWMILGREWPFLHKSSLTNVI